MLEVKVYITPNLELQYIIITKNRLFINFFTAKVLVMTSLEELQMCFFCVMLQNFL